MFSNEMNLPLQVFAQHSSRTLPKLVGRRFVHIQLYLSWGNWVDRCLWRYHKHLDLFRTVVHKMYKVLSSYKSSKKTLIVHIFWSMYRLESQKISDAHVDIRMRYLSLHLCHSPPRQES